MTTAGSGPFEAYEAEYQAILARAQHTVAGFPPLLRSLAELLLPRWGEASFSRIVALLPFWVADLLVRSPLPAFGPPVPRPGGTETLALANLLGWWSHQIQDGLVDREMDDADLLPLSMALHASAVRLLTQLLPAHPSFWEAFERLAHTSFEACVWEQQPRLAEFDAHGVDPADLDRLADRSALLQLAVVAQFAMHGFEQEHPLCVALSEMLRYYAIARQIGDDRSDWVQDLHNGRLNYVSNRLVHRMQASGGLESLADLDAEQIMGHYLCDDELFDSIQHEARAACQQAAQCIAPYRCRPLDSLVSELAQQLEHNHKAALRSRRKLQAAFALEGWGQ